MSAFQVYMTGSIGKAALMILTRAHSTFVRKSTMSLSVKSILAAPPAAAYKIGLQHVMHHKPTEHCQLGQHTKAELLADQEHIPEADVTAWLFG